MDDTGLPELADFPDEETSLARSLKIATWVMFAIASTFLVLRFVCQVYG